MGSKRLDVDESRRRDLDDIGWRHEWVVGQLGIHDKTTASSCDDRQGTKPKETDVRKGCWEVSTVSLD